MSLTRHNSVDYNTGHYIKIIIFLTVSCKISVHIYTHTQRPEHVMNSLIVREISDPLQSEITESITQLCSLRLRIHNLWIVKKYMSGFFTQQYDRCRKEDLARATVIWAGAENKSV